MSLTPTNRGGPPDSVLPLSTLGGPTGTMVAQQVCSPHQFLHYQRAILNTTVTQGTDLSLRATANGLAGVVHELEGKVEEIALEIGQKEEEIQQLEEGVSDRKAELGPLEEMLEMWAKKKA